MLRHKFLKFVEKLQYNTELRLILAVRDNEAPDLMLHDNTIPQVTLKNMTRPEAIEALKRILFIERKTEFVKGINLDLHKVIDIWERMNFHDNEGFNISARLSKRRKLIDIANDMEKRLTMN